MADETDYTRTFIGARYVPKFVDFSASNTYEPLSMVVVNDNIYISKKFVPAGVAVTNTEYWSMMPAFDTNSEQAIIDAVNNWLVAHPEATTTVQDGAITTAKLADGAVTDAKLASDGIKSVIDSAIVMNRSKNLFNPNDPDILHDNYLYPNGRFDPTTNRTVTGFMPVTSGKVMVVSYTPQSGWIQSVYSSLCFYAADKTTVVPGGAVNSARVTVPTGAAYARATLATSMTADGVKLQCELTDDGTATAYEPYFNPYPSLSDNIRINASSVDGIGVGTSEIGNLAANRGSLTSTQLVLWSQGSVLLVYFRCVPNTEYTIRKTYTNSEFKVAYIKELPIKGIVQPVYNYTSYRATDNEVTYKTGDGALYVLIQFGSGNAHTVDEILADTNVTYQEISTNSVDAITAESFLTANAAYLPADIYLVKGRDYEIYNDQICANSEQYSFAWTQGVALWNRVRLNYSTTGESILSCTIKNPDGTVAKLLRTTVHVVDTLSNGVSLLTLGDSLTNHCMWQAELMNMSGNITCVGSRSRTVRDSDDEERTVYDEGRSGFTTANYLDGTPYGGTLSDMGGSEEPNNRWYDPNTSEFSASYYFANNFPHGQTTPNVITVFLGMNDLNGAISIDESVSNVSTIIDSILAYDSTMRVVVMAPQLQYLPTLGNLERVRFIEYSAKIEQMVRGYDNTVFIPLAIGMDSTNNYPMVDITINTRRSEIEQTASDITHPSKYGYWQFSDYIFGAISYLIG